MQIHSPRRRVMFVCVAVLVAICCSATALAARGTARPLHLAGTWSGSYSGSYNGSFTLHWRQTGPKLTGSIALSNPKGIYAITGNVRGGKISFGAVAVGATYTGSASATSMSGTYKSPPGGGAWSAHKAS
jgi:hypothetical protein